MTVSSKIYYKFFAGIGLQRQTLKPSFKMMTKTLIKSNNVQPVSWAQMPNVPPSLAILSETVDLESSTVNSTSGLFNCSLTMIIFWVMVLILLKVVVAEFQPEIFEGQRRFFKDDSKNTSCLSIANSHNALDPIQISLQ